MLEFYVNYSINSGATAKRVQVGPFNNVALATNQRAILNNGVKKEDVRPGDHIKVRCHLLRDGAKGCLLGFITPMHGDAARGNGVEIEWD